MSKILADTIGEMSGGRGVLPSVDMLSIPLRHPYDHAESLSPEDCKTFLVALFIPQSYDPQPGAFQTWRNREYAPGFSVGEFLQDAYLTDVDLEEASERLGQDALQIGGLAVSFLLGTSIRNNKLFSAIQFEGARQPNYRATLYYNPATTPAATLEQMKRWRHFATPTLCKKDTETLRQK